MVMGYAGAGLVIGVYDVCWSLLLHLRGASGLQIGLSWTLFALPFAALSVPGGWLVDHFDRRYLAAASTLASAGFASTYPFLHSVWLLVGLGAAEAVAVSLAGPALAAQLATACRAASSGTPKEPVRRLRRERLRWRLLWPGRCSGCIPGSPSSGPRARSSSWWCCCRGAGGACRGGTRDRATRARRKPALFRSHRRARGPADAVPPASQMAGG